MSLEQQNKTSSFSQCPVADIFIDDITTVYYINKKK